MPIDASVARMTPSHDADGAAQPPLTADVDLPLTTAAAALARRTVTDVLRGWAIVDEDFTYDAVLLTSELVGNAVRHGGRRVALSLEHGHGRLTLAVSDGSSVLPFPSNHEDRESGRGLTIINAIADDWGVWDRPDGKTVWVTLTTPGAACRAASSTSRPLPDAARSA